MKLIAFDDHKETLYGIEAGNVFATIVQDGYQYGYEAVRLLADLLKKKENAIPFAGSGTFYLPCDPIKQDNLGDYRKKKQARVAARDAGHIELVTPRLRLPGGLLCLTPDIQGEEQEPRRAINYD